MASCVKKAPKKLSTSEKIDRIVTNCWLGIPIFVAAICLVYYIVTSQSARSARLPRTGSMTSSSTTASS